MLASFLVVLRPREVAPLGRTVGKSLHGLFLNLVRQGNPALADELHPQTPTTNHAPKPFTVSTLQGKFVTDKQRHRTYAVPDTHYIVRYTVLAAPLFSALSAVLQATYLKEEPVIIDGQPFDLLDVLVDEAQTGGWAGLTSYEQLAQQARQESKITLEWVSPTSFAQGDKDLLFPLPESVFGSYLTRWQAFSPIKIDDEGFIPFVKSAVFAERYTLHTEVVPYTGAQFNGCAGTCTYRVLQNPPDRERVRILNMLADFARFAGTGQKTTQGMGQTRRIEPR